MGRGNNSGARNLLFGPRRSRPPQQYRFNDLISQLSSGLAPTWLISDNFQVNEIIAEQQEDIIGPIKDTPLVIGELNGYRLSFQLFEEDSSPTIYFDQGEPLLISGKERVSPRLLPSAAEEVYRLLASRVNGDVSVEIALYQPEQLEDILTHYNSSLSLSYERLGQKRSSVNQARILENIADDERIDEDTYRKLVASETLDDLLNKNPEALKEALRYKDIIVISRPLSEWL